MSLESYESNSTFSQEKIPLAIKASFDLPLFQVTLKFEHQGGVDVKLHDFTFALMKRDNHSKNLDLKLQSLTVEDLFESENSNHRYLMVSNAFIKRYKEEPQFISTSCPTSMIDINAPEMPSSLPTSFSSVPAFSIEKRLPSTRLKSKR